MFAFKLSVTKIVVVWGPTLVQHWYCLPFKQYYAKTSWFGGDCKWRFVFFSFFKCWDNMSEMQMLQEVVLVSQGRTPCRLVPSAQVLLRSGSVAQSEPRTCEMAQSCWCLLVDLQF